MCGVIKCSETDGWILKENMDHRNKKYFVVSFLELPHPNMDKYVCVPRSWVTLRPEEQSSLVSYPNENPALTRNRIENTEPCEKNWPCYQATIAYITNNYDDADNWIATMYDDAVDCQCSNSSGFHLTTTIKSEVPDNNPFDVIDRLLNIKKEEPASPPPTTSSTWELFSNASLSPIRKEEQPEETSLDNPCPDITNPESKINLKRTISPTPDQNNNAKEAKLDNTASVHDDSNVFDKTLETCTNVGEKDLESYIGSFINELQSYISGHEANREEASDNNTVTAPMDANSTINSQAPLSTDKVDRQAPNSTKPRISVVPDEYLLENRGQTATLGHRNESWETPIPQPNPTNVSASQTLINLNNRQKELFKATPPKTQTHLQLPLRAPIENRRPSKPSDLRIRNITPKPSSTAQIPVSKGRQELLAQPIQTERNVRKNVSQNSAQMKVTPPGLTGMGNNQNAPPRSLPNQASPEIHTSCQLSMPDLGSPDSDFRDIPPPQNIAPNTAQQPINNVQQKLQSQPNQTERSLLRKNVPQSNSQELVTRTGNSPPRSLPSNSPFPKTHNSRQSSMPDSGVRDIPQPQFISPKSSSTAQPAANTAQQELKSPQTQRDQSLLRKDVPLSCSQIPVVPAGCQKAPLNSLPDDPASPETDISRRLSMPSLGRRDSGFVDFPQPFSPSDALFIAESPAPSCPNTGIPQNTTTFSENITRVENQLPRRPSQDPNSTDNKRKVEQGEINQINSATAVENAQRSATPQRPNNTTSMANDRTNSSSVGNHPQKRVEVPLTVELLSHPERQQHLEPNSNVSTAESIDKITEQRKNSQDALKPPPFKQDSSKAAKLLSEPPNDNNLTLLVKGYLLEDPSSGVLFVQPACPGQNILEPRRSSLNPIKQECVENTTQRMQEVRHQNSHSRGQYQEPDPEIVSQNIQHSEHPPLNRNNIRPDPQMNLPNTQSTMNYGHQRSNPQNTPPVGMHASNQRPADQIDQHIMNGNNQRNYSRMNPQEVLYMATNGGYHRPDGQIGPNIARRPVNTNEASQGLKHQNIRNPVDIVPQRNPQSTQQPVNGTHQRPNFHPGPPNTQNPMNGSNQRFAQARGHQNGQQSINRNDDLNISINTGNRLDELNNVIQQLQAEVSALRAQQPNYQMNASNQRPNPQIIAQNRGQFVNMHNQPFDPQAVSQFLENTRQPLNGSNERPIPQMNICNRKNANNHMTDPQTGPQITRQPMYMNNNNNRPNLQIDQHCRNPVTAGNRMPDPQMNSGSIINFTYSGVPIQGFETQMPIQNSSPMNGSNQRSVPNMQQRRKAQMHYQNNGAQNWNTGNHQTSFLNNNSIVQQKSVSQNHFQDPQANASVERSNHGSNIEFGRRENLGRFENRGANLPNNGTPFQQLGPQARNTDGQMCTYNPMNGSGQQSCRCQSCKSKYTYF
ncbi:homeobox protein 5 isoform X1 [Helicoverpa armigera]|uniref:homeobox protein 5 isoform X1 n=1 Tax=Helicoverpa armigera TaxID=29058 RepID=UPI0030828307